MTCVLNWCKRILNVIHPEVTLRLTGRWNPRLTNCTCSCCCCCLRTVVWCYCYAMLFVCLFFWSCFWLVCFLLLLLLSVVVVFCFLFFVFCFCFLFLSVVLFCCCCCFTVTSPDVMDAAALMNTNVWKFVNSALQTITPATHSAQIVNNHHGL